MSEFVSLGDHLTQWSTADPVRNAVAAAIMALAEACRELAAIIADGDLGGRLAAQRGAMIGGDVQRELDVRANELLIDALSSAPVAAVASEEMETPLPLAIGAPLLLAIDPLDGSSNIETNLSVGTIFSILPNIRGCETIEAFLIPGRQQLAAGYVLYGPQTALVLTLGAGTDIFTLERSGGVFRRSRSAIRVPARTYEIAINAANYRHWDPPVRVWFDDCLAGFDGPRGENFNMRWLASMVAEAHRILARGGIYLYPGDARPGYRHGRLRLIYEANPIAMLMEQAGAAASSAVGPILDRPPRALHERVPLVFGSSEEVKRLERYHLEPHPIGERSPLFGRRGLFRA